MTRKEKIIDIAAKFYLPPVKSMKDVVKMDQWCEDLANEIMALPIDVPSKEEIEEFIISHPDNTGNFILGAGISAGFKVGAKWAIEQIIERNQK